MASRLKNIKEADKVWRQAIAPVDSNIGKLIQNLNDIGTKVILIVDNVNRLVDAISNGDIRRGWIMFDWKRSIFKPDDTIDKLINEPILVNKTFRDKL